MIDEKKRTNRKGRVREDGRAVEGNAKRNIVLKCLAIIRLRVRLSRFAALNRSCTSRSEPPSPLMPELEATDFPNT